jgi:hypothetical protein
VKGPAVDRARYRGGVPELRLQQLTTRRIEAAQVGDRGRVMAAQLRVQACLQRTA